MKEHLSKKADTFKAKLVLAAVSREPKVSEALTEKQTAEQERAKNAYLEYQRVPLLIASGLLD